MAKSSITLFAQKLEENEGLLIENRKEYDSFLEQAPPGRYVIEVKRSRPPRSQKQLGNIFGNMIDKIVYQVNEVDFEGIDGFVRYLLDKSIPKNCPANADSVKVALRNAIKRTSPEEIKTILYKISPTLNEIGEEITLRDMDTKQAAVFTDRIVNMVAGYVVIRDPDKNWRAKKQKK